MKRLFMINIFIALFSPSQAFACGQCVDANLQMFFPFLIFWFMLFLFWAFVIFVICVIAKIRKNEIDFVHSEKPGRTLFLRVIIFIGISLLSLGSLLFPILVLVAPLWFKSIRRRIKQGKAQQSKGKLLDFHYYFNWVTALLLVVIVVYSYVDYNSTTEMFGAKKYLEEKAQYKSAVKVK